MTLKDVSLAETKQQDACKAFEGLSKQAKEELTNQQSARL